VNSSVRWCPTTQLMLRVAALTLLALSTLTVSAFGRVVATSASGGYVYDAPTIACVRVHAIGPAEASPPLVSDGRDGSAPPTAKARGTSTTSPRSFIATEAGINAEGGVGAAEYGPQMPGGPKPTPNFKPPTNPAQLPPSEIPPGWQVREMPPTEQYPDGYWKLEKPMPNGGWQPIDPSTMKPGGRPETHVPFPPGG
jgi:hypothetical protein